MAESEEIYEMLNLSGFRNKNIKGNLIEYTSAPRAIAHTYSPTPWAPGAHYMGAPITILKENDIVVQILFREHFPLDIQHMLIF